MARGETPLPVRLAISLAVIVALLATLVVIIRNASTESGTRLSAAFSHAGQGLDPNSPSRSAASRWAGSAR
nr:hypothetical protein GCM10020093_000300 [Planobispora longispora]BFE89111.1 hypothetical protein GCM10020093_117120 [Planobispora longispora]